MNIRFCITWAKMNHFEMRFVVLSQKVGSKLLRMASLLKNFDEKRSKMAIEIVQILDFFHWNEF